MKINVFSKDHNSEASPRHDVQLSNHLFCLKVWQSEIQFMARLADQWGDIETGGDIYGLKGHDDSIVIMLATPPGPNAIHEHAHFRQDIEYLNKNNELLEGIYGLTYDGNHHNHHGLSIKGVSGGDIQSIHAIAKRNGYKHMCQIVITFEDSPNTNHDSHSNFEVLKPEQQDPIT